MEIIIGSVLFKAFMKGSSTQNSSCNAKLTINKPKISSVLGDFSSEKARHNCPGTPIERLSLKTTVILIMFLLPKIGTCTCKISILHVLVHVK